eukprot:gene43792-53553_t
MKAASNLGSKEIVVNPLVYYQKPALGGQAGQDTTPRTPVQLVYPSGGFGLGLQAKDVENGRAGAGEQAEEHHGVLASAPLNSPLDQRQIHEYKTAFLVLAVVNLVLTFSMYFSLDSMDVSAVESRTGQLPSPFAQIPAHRRPIEDRNFVFLVITHAVGILAVAAEHVLGISAFSLAVLLNFFLGTAALPSLLYALRYVLDFVLLYLALVLRSRLSVSFLVLSRHRLQ